MKSKRIKIRGGSWRSCARDRPRRYFCNGVWYDVDVSHHRTYFYKSDPGNRYFYFGFRVVSPFFVKNKRKVGK